MIVEFTRRVYLQDTDASGLLFFGAPTRWMAEGESEVFIALGRDPLGDDVGAPVRSTDIEYLAPVHLHDDLVQRSWVSHVGTTSFHLSHEFWGQDQLKVRGTTRHVCVSLSSMRPIAVPEEFREAIPEEVPRRGDTVA